MSCRDAGNVSRAGRAGCTENTEGAPCIHDCGVETLSVPAVYAPHAATMKHRGGAVRALACSWFRYSAGDDTPCGARTYTRGMCCGSWTRKCAGSARRCHRAVVLQPCRASYRSSSYRQCGCVQGCVVDSGRARVGDPSEFDGIVVYMLWHSDADVRYMAVDHFVISSRTQARIGCH